MPFPNKYPGKCKACGTEVPEREGLAFRDGHRWRVVCKAADCMARTMSRAELEREHGKTQTRREIDAAGRVHVWPPDRETNRMIAIFPGARFHGNDPSDKHWTVSTAPEDRAKVVEIADKLKLSVPESWRQVELTDWQRRAKERMGEAESRGLVPYPYQREGILTLATKRRYLLGDDMGLGKTAQALLALDDDGAVVVCPASVKRNWANEVRLWRPELEATVLEGRGSFRWPAPGEVVILNYEILPDAAKLPESEREPAWGVTLIADEAHRLKNHKSQRHKRFKKLAESCSTVWLLTGTPLLGNPFDLRGVLQSADLARPAFGSWQRFLKLFSAHKDEWGGYHFGKPDDRVPAMLDRVMLRRLKVDVQKDLPRKVYTDILVDLDKRTAKALDKAWLDYVSEHDTGELPPIDRFSAIRKQIAEARIPAMLDWISDAEENEVPVLVFSAHRAPIDALEDREGWATITGDTPSAKRQGIVDRFQSGKLRGLALTIGAGREGINITRATAILFVDKDWTPALNEQAEDRSVRIGNVAESVAISTLVLDHKLDKHVHKLLRKKRRLIDQTVDGSTDVSATAQTTFDDTRATIAAAIDRQEELNRDERLAAARRRARKIGGFEEFEVTPELRQVVKDAWSAMLDRCDGAHLRDGQGFNKPDAVLAHKIQPVLDDDDAVRVAYYTLRSYRKQLESSFPALFRREAS